MTSWTTYFGKSSHSSITKFNQNANTHNFVRQCFHMDTSVGWWAKSYLHQLCANARRLAKSDDFQGKLYCWHIFMVHITESYELSLNVLQQFGLVWFGLVGILRHINHCRSFNTKSSLNIYNKYIRFCFIGFYGISTIAGYLMLNPLYTYILNI